ncbi:hypothetical protein Kpol_259p1 [Vanderwaltozyma polyspora DSM 70294]|uniref:RRM domain-containing protein n=1 Tax=Vanderwaltozyma polyspora (strain ATCC 22028 / DSM 70294 / BCRC 21397 / CBS 2163 / NBRC 10782 / NRRL Y-8283 / UCD 57-17) TaxID=436907 RepID=A7TT64_VANPO|nr:uncharacterized protein Kpol_259p1 [Vanderwaltozyma polyspora DSM 70294]EDO14538.1 hypothetical protein Kpol_259p1 [Vanderwaltozyma polyspora DSM 70294]
MFYNASKYPNDVALLMKPRAPLKFLKQSDNPLNQRKTNPNISGVSSLLSNNTLTDYMNEFPVGTDNKHLQKYELVRNQKINELNKLDDELMKWNPNNDPNVKDTDPYRTIFVGRLPYDVNEMDLQKLFNKFGQIEKVRIVRDKKTITKTNPLGNSRGYAFIVFADQLSSKMACKEIGVHRGIEINGRNCIVDIERGRTVKYFKPRRFGGGLGGRGYTKRERLTKITSQITSISTVETEFSGMKRKDPFPGRPSHQTRVSRFSNTKSIQGSRYNTYTPTSTFTSSTASTIESTSTRHFASTEITERQPSTTYRSRSARSQESKQQDRSNIPDY